MKASILTIHPKFFQGILREGLLGKAIQRNVLRIDIIDIRRFATDKHHRVDDRPYGGGPGMVLKVEPIVRALGSIVKPREKTRIVVLAAKGKRFTQRAAQRLSRYEHLVLICGRYEGIDERVAEFYADEEFRIGDYVLMGGEAAAAVILEATSRHLPEVLGNPQSLAEESFSIANEREYAQYTRPPEFDGHKVPEVLLKGNHKDVELWRKKRAKR